MNNIYTHYKDRLIEASTQSRALFTKKITAKINYDLGAVLKKTDINKFEDFLTGKKNELVFLNKTCDFDTEIANLKTLKSEIDDIEKNIGEKDLYIGYPFIIGETKQGTLLKAPLFLCKINLNLFNTHASVSHITGCKLHLNKSLLLTLKKDCGVNNLPLEAELIGDFQKILDNCLQILNENGISVKIIKNKTLKEFDSSTPKQLTLKPMVIMGRFSISNPIYNDYSEMENYCLSSPEIDLLLHGKSIKQKKNTSNLTYNIYNLDYSQNNATKMINSVTNMVIYGPPGTGKSQTISSIIGDAICKNEKILVVSQKKAALDVIFSRLGNLNKKAMLITDIDKDSECFYTRIKNAHSAQNGTDLVRLYDTYQQTEKEINSELKLLKQLQNALTQESKFGLNLLKMYELSYNIGKKSVDYELYTKLLKTAICNTTYNELSNAIDYIKSKNILGLYTEYKKYYNDNPIFRHLKINADIHDIKKCQTLLSAIHKKVNIIAPRRLDYGQYIDAFFLPKKNKRITTSYVAKLVIKTEYRELHNATIFSLLPIFWVMAPFVLRQYFKKKTEITLKLDTTLKEISDLENIFTDLHSLLDDEGYSIVIENIAHSNFNILKKLSAALTDYSQLNNIRNSIENLPLLINDILKFCYDNSAKTELALSSVLDKLLKLRIYHELIKSEKSNSAKLQNSTSFRNICNRILQLKSKQNELAAQIADTSNSDNYKQRLKTEKSASEYLYLIQNKHPNLSIREFIQRFNPIVLDLFPCWLLSPQEVSTIFPLERNLFDIVIFDEASQIFIENSIPTIYRGKRIIVAGDNKQLEPTTSFVRRSENHSSLTANGISRIEPALEAISLLDLAEARYTPLYLNYHYRSASSELIDFSNQIFYNNKLQIAPNIELNKKQSPIERIKVSGIWENRQNVQEAEATITLLKSIFKNREKFESIGIITFNTEQKKLIEEHLESAMKKSPTFANEMLGELNRIENGENKSLFIKNLENVQGDERDIIIFNIGYAKNKAGKLNFRFGALSQTGGENRLNVAITRAKKKIYIITSIEPEELANVASAKNNGPKLLQKYLLYARAVSNGNTEEAKLILNSLSTEKNNLPTSSISANIKAQLETKGYIVHENVGNSQSAFSLAVYDKSLEKYILGIEFDSEFCERNVEDYISRLNFYESKGWKITRVWSRDWWLSPIKVMDGIINDIETAKSVVSSMQN